MFSHIHPRYYPLLSLFLSLNCHHIRLHAHGFHLIIPMVICHLFNPFVFTHSPSLSSSSQPLLFLNCNHMRLHAYGIYSLTHIHTPQWYAAYMLTIPPVTCFTLLFLLIHPHYRPLAIRIFQHDPYSFSSTQCLLLIQHLPYRPFSPTNPVSKLLVIASTPQPQHNSIPS